MCMLVDHYQEGLGCVIDGCIFRVADIWKSAHDYTKNDVNKGL